MANNFVTGPYLGLFWILPNGVLLYEHSNKRPSFTDPLWVSHGNMLRQVVEFVWDGNVNQLRELFSQGTADEFEILAEQPIVFEVTATEPVYTGTKISTGNVNSLLISAVLSRRRPMIEYLFVALGSRYPSRYRDVWQYFARAFYYEDNWYLQPSHVRIPFPQEYRPIFTSTDARASVQLAAAYAGPMFAPVVVDTQEGLDNISRFYSFYGLDMKNAISESGMPLANVSDAVRHVRFREAFKRLFTGGHSNIGPVSCCEGCKRRRC